MAKKLTPETIEAAVTPLFSKPIYQKLTSIDTKKIVSMLEEYSFHITGEIDTRFLSATMGGLTITDKRVNSSSATNNKFVLEDENFKFLKDELMKEFYLFASNLMKFSNEFEITTSWFTKSLRGQSSASHNHNNCMISGIFYLQADENSGNISFFNYDNRRYDLKIEEPNVYNSKQYEFTPTGGMLLLFPSEVWHKVEENKSDDIRYSLAFNLSPIGLIGNTKSDSHMIQSSESL